MEKFDVDTIVQKSNDAITQIDDLVTATGGECDWILQKGKNTGSKCGKRCVLETSRCKYHYDKEQEEVGFVQDDLLETIREFKFGELEPISESESEVSWCEPKPVELELKHEPKIVVTIVGSKVTIEVDKTQININ